MFFYFMLVSKFISNHTCVIYNQYIYAIITLYVLFAVNK